MFGLQPGEEFVGVVHITLVAVGDMNFHHTAGVALRGDNFEGHLTGDEMSFSVLFLSIIETIYIMGLDENRLTKIPTIEVSQMRIGRGGLYNTCTPRTGFSSQSDISP